MPPRRANNNKNANSRNSNAAPPAPDPKISNGEFINAIYMLAHSMTNKNNRVHAHVNENGGSLVARVHDFVRMNLSEFIGS